MTPQEIKAKCEEIWNAPGVQHSGHITGFSDDSGFRMFAGKACGEYVSKETRKWRSQFAMYNKALKAIVQASAIEIRREDTEDGQLTHYVFKSEPKTPEPALEPETVPEPIAEPALEPVKPARRRRRTKAEMEAARASVRTLAPIRSRMSYREMLTARFIAAI